MTGSCQGSTSPTANRQDVSEMFDWYKHADKLAYFFIAVAIYLLLRAFTIAHVAPLTNVLLYVSVAISLLASNVPKVIDIPLHSVYAVRRVEIFTFGLAIVCFIVLCVRYLRLPI